MRLSSWRRGAEGRRRAVRQKRMRRRRKRGEDRRGAGERRWLVVREAVGGCGSEGRAR